jgi:hypothetical protein
MIHSQRGNLWLRSAAPGHELPRLFVAVVAAVPLMPDTKAVSRRGREGQKPTLCRSLDHLVRAGNDLRWHCEAKRLGGREVDDQFDLCGPLDR